MSPAEQILWWAVTLTGLALSALFSGAEMGCYSVNRVRLIVRAEGFGRAGPDRLARLLRREIEQPERLLATLLIGNNVANYLGSLGVAALLASRGYGDWAIVGINAAILTPLLFVFGETLPKDLFRADADRLTPRIAPLLAGARALLTALLLVPLVRAFAHALSRLLRLPTDAMIDSARGRVAALLHEGVVHGVLSEAQMALVDRALTLRDLKVRDQMVRWSRAAVVGDDWSRARVEQALRAAPHSRWPVVDRRAAVVGVLEAAELWLTPDASVRDLMKPALRLAPDEGLREAILRMRAAGAKLAVVEERAAPVGVVTLRDLTAPLLGQARPPDYAPPRKHTA